MKKVGIALAVLFVILAALAAAWYWAGPWLAQEYIDFKHPGWDVIHVERYEEQKVIVFLVAFPEQDFDADEIHAYLADVAQVARILRLPGYNRLVILFCTPVETGYLMQVELIAPITKTDWESPEGTMINPLWFWGARLSEEYISWPD